MAIEQKKIHPDNFRRLYEDEIEDPGQVVQTFFENYPLRSCYTRLWQLLLGYMESDYASCNAPKELGSILYFYERLEAILEAIYLLHTKMDFRVNETSPV